MKKFNYFILSCIALFLATTVTAQTTVLGYFPSYRATSAVDAQYSKLTDIVFAFINPNTNGTLNLNNTDATFGFDNNKFVTIKAGASSNNVKLWIALGGADDGELRSARLNSVCANNTYRASLVGDLVSFAITHGLEGIDLDWEFPKTTQARTGQLNLIKDLRAAINGSSNTSLKISVAVGGEYKNAVNHLQFMDAGVISDASLVDKFNIMAYDFPTSYNANHSSYADAQGAMEEWNAVKGVPYSKMLLGIPFYGRSSWNEIEYNNLGGTASTNYTADSYNGYYYNGKTTIEAKMDLVSTKGAKGILIWDLGQDRSDAYSLLSAIDAKAATLCAIPKANLGADRGVCSGATTTLDPGVATAGGRTFAWTKDGSSTGGNTATIDVNTAGTYAVTISDASCSRTDEIIIVTGSSVTTNAAVGCDNVSLTVSVNSPDGAKTYKWYDAASAGTQLGTGTSYSAVFPTSTTVYVEEAAAGVATYTSSPATVPEGLFYGWCGSTYTYRVAQRIVVDQDLTIKSLRAITSKLSGITFNVKVVNSSNYTDVTEVGPFTKEGTGGAASWEQEYFDFDVNIALTAGSYFVVLEPAAGSETNYGVINGHNEESKEAGIYTLYAGAHQASATVTYSETDMGSAYGPFINWVIETGANASCGRTATSVTVAPCGPPTVDITTPTAAEDFTFTSPATTATVNLSATISDEGTLSSVVFEIYDGATLIETVSTNNSGGTYTGTYTGALGSYTLKVIATDNDANVTEKTVAFTISTLIAATVLSADDVQLYPNPSSAAFQITIGDASSFELSVYTVAGQLLSTQNVDGNSASFGADLSAGSYVVKVVSAAGTYQTQVVKK
ncbi:MAG: GH18 family chitinase [Glaciecola sp.]|jgi:GH18 family chitinase